MNICRADWSVTKEIVNKIERVFDKINSVLLLHTFIQITLLVLTNKTSFCERSYRDIRAETILSRLGIWRPFYKKGSGIYFLVTWSLVSLSVSKDFQRRPPFSIPPRRWRNGEFSEEIRPSVSAVSLSSPEDDNNIMLINCCFVFGYSVYKVSLYLLLALDNDSF